MTSNFEPFIDKADLTVPIFDRAVAFMENGRAATVSEALELAKNPDVAVAPEAPCEPAAEETGDSAEPAAVDATEAAPSDETPFEASSLEAVDSVHEVLPEAQSPFDGSNQ